MTDSLYQLTEKPLEENRMKVLKAELIKADGKDRLLVLRLLRATIAVIQAVEKYNPETLKAFHMDSKVAIEVVRYLKAASCELFRLGSGAQAQSHLGRVLDEHDEDVLDEDVRSYPVWYGTNREPLEAADVAKGFSERRSRQISYGVHSQVPQVWVTGFGLVEALYALARRPPAHPGAEARGQKPFLGSYAFCVGRERGSTLSARLQYNLQRSRHSRCSDRLRSESTRRSQYEAYQVPPRNGRCGW